ncbi:hypothetical protein GCM10025868_31640 [Angustibacter aerolatus]|uniref:Uncharacterized protein n=1 Tax=Angustibacter aerolatus TaxID=1162965 RepID=A0ABQ6JJ65_9ACTN|nr:hypothetical protein GCM10025868_31640 [Angustibacter aerolatus]
MAAAALTVGWIALRQHAPRRARGWRSCWPASAGRVVGDVVWSLETTVLQRDTYPLWSDVVYLAGYGLMGVGALHLVRSRRAGRDVTAFLDAAIVTAGVAVPVITFLVLPATHDSDLSVLGRLVSAAYPVGDLFVLALLARLMATPGATTAAFRLLAAAVGVTLLADSVYQVMVSADPGTQGSVLLDAGWLAAYVLVGAAAAHPRCGCSPSRRRTGRRRRPCASCCCSPSGRCCPAPASSSTAPATATSPGCRLGVGSLALSLLVLTRMARLLEQVQVQAVQARRAGPRRRADRRAEPPLVGPRAVAGVRARPRHRRAAGRRDPRPRPLQAL